MRAAAPDSIKPFGWRRSSIPSTGGPPGRNQWDSEAGAMLDVAERKAIVHQLCVSEMS